MKSISIKTNKYGDLNEFGIIVDKLVKSADSTLHLTEEEKCIIAECAFSGVHKILDKRYKKQLNKTRIHKIEV